MQIVLTQQASPPSDNIFGYLKPGLRPVHKLSAFTALARVWRFNSTV